MNRHTKQILQLQLITNLSNKQETHCNIHMGQESSSECNTETFFVVLIITIIKK